MKKRPDAVRVNDFSMQISLKDEWECKMLKQDEIKINIYPLLCKV